MDPNGSRRKTVEFLPWANFVLLSAVSKQSEFRDKSYFMFLSSVADCMDKLRLLVKELPSKAWRETSISHKPNIHILIFPNFNHFWLCIQTQCKGFISCLNISRVYFPLKNCYHYSVKSLHENVSFFKI